MIEDLTLRKAVEFAITTEQLGAEYYGHMQRKFQEQQNLKEIFGQLVKDEKLHEAQFKTILKRVPEDKPEDQQYELYQYLRATAISEFFREDYFKKIDDIKTADQALGRALAFEKATLQFYGAIKDILKSSSDLDEIIKTERSHIITLMKVLTSDAKFRGLGDMW